VSALPSWLDSLLARLGFTEWVNELRAVLRWGKAGEPLDAQPTVRSEPSQSPPTESTMPKKAKIQKTSRPQRAKTAKKAAKPAAKKAAAKRGASASKRSTGASRAATAEAVKQLVDALQAHPQQKDLVTAGQQQKDQLLRSLIPLYLARSLGVEVTSGTTSRFWSKFGVSYAAPNAAKALRIHTGYASETKKGRAITAKGIRYVEDAIARG
jgi:pyruvate/2-oxoglutarate dehydrogenase complex dihydrolipoamide acyltransferase (E2) component